MSDDIKVGDRFELTFTARSVTSVGGVWATIDGDHSCERVFLHSSQVALGRRLPRAIKVGDRVKGLVSSFSGRGAVLAVDGNEAWVKWSDGTRSTASLVHLTLIPGDET